MTAPDDVRRTEKPGTNLKGETATGLVVLVLCVFFGAPAGLIWAALRPNLDPLVVSAAAESALRPQFTADLTLALLGLGAGAIAGILAWALLRRHGSGAAIGLALGGYAAMRVAAHIGKLAAHPDQLQAITEGQLAKAHDTLSGTPAQVREFLDLLSFHLRAGAVFYSFSIAALLLFGSLTYLRDRSSPAPVRVNSGFGAAGSGQAPVRPSGL